jgi:hypothetical protein
MTGGITAIDALKNEMHRHRGGEGGQATKIPPLQPLDRGFPQVSHW